MTSPSTLHPLPSTRLVRVLMLIPRLVVGAILFYAGFMKAVAPSAEFAAAIETYRILPGPWITPVAMALPWIEMWTGTFLIFGYFTSLAAGVASALFGLFVVALGSTLVRHLDLASCGCFGLETLSPRQTILMDIGLFMVALVLSRIPASWHLYTTDSWLE